MSHTKFAMRPWGRFDWILDRLPAGDWDFIGCVSSEERCLSVPRAMRQRGATGGRRGFLDVVAPPGHPAGDMLSARRAMHAEALDVDFRPNRTETRDLLANYGEIVSALRAVSGLKRRRVILDVTCMPKRFFFAAIRLLLRDDAVSDLVVTYAKASGYTDEALHEDAGSAVHLPGFGPGLGGEAPDRVRVVGLGFDTPGLLQVLEVDEVSKNEFLFPVPSPPPYFARNWDFLRHATHGLVPDSTTVTRVSSTDVSGVFDELKACTAGGTVTSVLAPYGPKPVSIAMCLFAIACGSDLASVVYTQPRYYDAVYSTGTAVDSTGPVIYAYPLRVRGQDLYGI